MQKRHATKGKSVILHSPPVWGQGGQLSPDEFKRERLYQVCIAIARRMLAKNIITEDTHFQIDAFLLEKHRPLLGGLKVNARDLSAQSDE